MQNNLDALVIDAGPLPRGLQIGAARRADVSKLVETVDAEFGELVGLMKDRVGAAIDLLLEGRPDSARSALETLNASLERFGAASPDQA